jgi:small-conductance mechanosensitive channel
VEVASPPETTNKIDGYPVLLDNEPLFVVRQGVGMFSAQERAQAISQRLSLVARDPSIMPEQIQLVQESGNDLVYLRVDDTIILTISAQDAKAYRASQTELGQRALTKIRAAISQYREERSVDYLLESLGYTVLASITLIVIIRLILYLSGKFFPAITTWLNNRLPIVKIQNFEIISAYHISQFCLRILQFIRFFFCLTIFYVYISFVLGLFPWTRTISESILGYFFVAVEFMGQGIAQYIPNLIILALICLITYYLLKAIKPFFWAIERGNLNIPGFYQEWAEPTYRLILILIIALAAVVAFPYLPGFDSPAFRGISVFLGILFSLGSTSAVANVVGGVILIYTRAFQSGDCIQIGDVIGIVLEKTLLVTRIMTPTNRIITIPNSSLLSSNVINLSAAARELKRYLILQTTVTLGYDLPWRKVHETLIQAALATTDILSDPRPFVLQTSLDDFYVSYQLNAHTDHPDRMVKIYAELHQNIQDYCNQVGIEILSPSYYALRDGHQSTIPENYLPSDYQAPGFRVSPIPQGDPPSS